MRLKSVVGLRINLNGLVQRDESSPTSVGGGTLTKLGRQEFGTRRSLCQEGSRMAVEIEPREDRRVQEIIKDPSGYFSQARARVRDEVVREIERERTYR